MDFGICIHPSALRVCGTSLATDLMLSCDTVDCCVIVGLVIELSIFHRERVRPSEGEFVVLSLMTLITSGEVEDRVQVLTSICCQTLIEWKEP